MTTTDREACSEILLVQTGNIRTEGDKIAVVQENYSDGFAVACNLPQIFAECFFPPRRQWLPLVGFLRLIIAVIGPHYRSKSDTLEAEERCRDLFSGEKNLNGSQLVSSSPMQKPLDFQHPSHQVSSVFGHDFALFRLNGFQCLSSNSTRIELPARGNDTDGDCPNAVEPVEIPALPLPRKWRDIVSKATAIILTTLMRVGDLEEKERWLGVKG